MHTLRINEQLTQYPSSWDELSRKQLFYVVRLFLSGHSETQLKLRSVLSFLNLEIGNKPARMIKGELHHYFKFEKMFPFLLSDGHLLSLIESMNFLILKEDKYTPGKSLDSNLTRNLIPMFRVRLRRYYGPSDRLFNLTFREFIHSENYFIEWLETDSQKDLDNLIAVLYRPQDENYNPASLDYKGDRRVKFNDFLIEKRAETFSKIPMPIKFAIVLYYQGCRKALHNTFKSVFSAKSGNTSHTSNIPGYLTLVDSMTNNDVTKTELVMDSLLYTVLVHLENIAVTNDKKEQALKNKTHE